MTTHSSAPPSSARPSSRSLISRRSRRAPLVAAVLVGVLGTLGWVALRSTGSAELLPTAVSQRNADDGAGDGALPDAGTTVDDTHLDAVARLDPELLEAVRQATAAAADDGIELRITSGWRSAKYQQQLLDEAIARHGERGARQLVQTPDRSRHVTGDAVDVGPTDAAFWMLRHGSRFGLCQVHANEIWHYELLVDPGGTCPPLRQDAS